MVLMGHLPAELREAAALIKAEYRAVEVRIIVLDAIDATPQEVETDFESISSLPITLLVNSVDGFPIAQPATGNLFEFMATDLGRSFNLKRRFHGQRIPNIAPLTFQC
ncbi:hypothetical protein AAE478_005731 [Parahypoxylon ruwenzoriense]